MNFRKILVFTALIVTAGNSQAWNLVYATDVNGSVTAGSLQILRTAVDNGATVKVLTTAPSGDAQHIWTVICTNVSLRFDSLQSVVCVSHDDFVMNAAMGSQFGTVISPGYSGHFLLSTSGQYAQANLRRTTGEVLSNTINVYPMRWYVE